MIQVRMVVHCYLLLLLLLLFLLFFFRRPVELVGFDGRALHDYVNTIYLFLIPDTVRCSIFSVLH